MYLIVFIITFLISFSSQSTTLGPEQDGPDLKRDEIMDDIMLKREAAAEFFQRDRRGLNHECYAECCNWEEVREHYEHDISAANKYWNKYKNWTKKNSHCKHGGGWSW